MGEGSKSWLFCYATTKGITFTAEKARDQALDERDDVSAASPSTPHQTHTPYTLHPTPCTLNPTPYNLHPASYT